MPSEKVLEQKKQVVAELSEVIGGACAGVLVDYKGITVEEDTKLRADLRAANVKYAVIKNTLLGLAIKDTSLEGMSEFLSGTSALATSADDYVAAARILNKFAEGSKTFSIKTGFLDGEIIDEEKIKSLAKLPSREILLATVCNVFNAPIASFARAVQAIVDKQNGAPAAEAEA